MIHQLKTVNPFFNSVWIGEKTAEIRKADRPFRVGDGLELKEYDPSGNSYLGRIIFVRVTHIMTSDEFPEGLRDGYVMISFKNDALVR